jgi:NADPH:quinone reductase
MKAVVIHEFGSPDKAVVQDIETPVPGSQELVIDVAFAPVNFVDLLVFKGKYQFLPDIPFVPGKGPVGTVRSIGSSVTNFSKGDRILAMAEHGGYAQCAIANESQCYKLPDNLSFQDAACISLAYDTAWFALFERARMKPGESVLVLGATGAVGEAAIQLARAKGAHVIAAVSSETKANQVIASGAHAVVDLSGDNLKDNFREQVYSVNSGKGVDVIIDPLGGHIFDAAIRALAWRGRLVVVGFAAGGIPNLKVNYLLLKNIEVSGIQISDYRKRMPDLVKQCFEEIFALYGKGQISARPAEIFPLEDYAIALGRLVNRQATGRLLLSP